MSEEWRHQPREAAEGVRSIPIERPSGYFFVEMGRTGVQPGGASMLGFPVWLVTLSAAREH